MDPLAYVFSAANAARRNLKDFASDPLALIERQVDALRNTTRGREAVVNDQGAGMREIPREEQIRRMTEGATDTLSGGLGVIKPKGGNWLSGRFGVEKQLESLKKGATPEETQRLLQEGIVTPEGVAQVGAVDSWVDRQLTKYIKNDMASPSDPVRLMLDKFPEEKAAKLAQAEAKVQALRQKQEAQAAARGVPPEMLTRTRAEVLAAEEARDLIQENTGLHYAPAYTTDPSRATINRRIEGGFPEAGLGQTDLARVWENAADSTIGRGLVREFQLPSNLKQDPWLATAEPKAPVYNFASADQVGVGRLVDELRNSLAEGRLAPEQLGKMPVDQAVRHVAEVNALRAVEANKARARDMADMPVYKDYPEQGMSWRQLASEDRSQLEKWLKQEGDAMGHCVGGYCEDVASGSSNIYSLRDAKGQPYTTIETMPTSDAIWDNEAAAERLWAQAEAQARQTGEDVEVLFDKLATDWGVEAAKNPGMMINQIKGPRNESPDPKYFPLIQDFIRSGKWATVQDVEHTGLTPQQIDEILKGQQ